MLVTSLSLLQRNKKKPDVAKLLYGKRKNAYHQQSPAKPSVTTLLANVPLSQVDATVRHALRMKEVSEEDIVAVLKHNRSLRRYDLSEAFVDALRKEKQSLSAYHYAILMAHANDMKDTERTLRWWRDAVREGKANEKLHGAVLAAYRNSGHWRGALEHCDRMWEDKLVLDSHAMHTVMNACRRNGPWASGLEFFSQAVSKGSTPNAVVYLELLRLISNARFPRRWSYGLAVLRALGEKVELTAGHYNAVLTTFGGANWERGVELYRSMKAQNITPSTDTLQTLLLLKADNVTHCVRCVAEAHALGLPVTDTMYRATITNLFRMELDHEASQFVEREYGAAMADVGNPVRSSLNLGVALLDSLLAHPRPRSALHLFRSFESELGNVVGGASQDLGSLGTLSQRWLVQGRVAVVDHNVLLSPNFESLKAHYDSVFVPFSSVRLLVRRSREFAGTTKGRYIHVALRNVDSVVTRGKNDERVFRVLPLSHQLQAHTYLVGGPTTTESIKELHQEARKHFPTYSQKLLDSVEGETDVAGSGEGAATAAAATPIISIRAPNVSVKSVDEPRENLPALVVRRQDGGGAVRFPHFPDRITSAERTLAVAVMLKTLNPDADIHVLSNNKPQLHLVSEWSSDRPQTPLTPLCYPDELFEKAPPASSSSLSAGDMRTKKAHAAPEEGVFVPS